MSGPLLILLAVALVAVYGFATVASNRVRKHGFLILVWRFLTGHPWHGKPVTDAGWLRPGGKALTRTGHASRFHHRPRWQRALYRTGSTVGVIAAAYGLLVARTTTEKALAAAVLATFLLVVWRAWRAFRRRVHRRTWITPLHAAVAPLVGVPLPSKPESWLRVERDRSKAVLELPQGHLPADRDRDAIARTAAAKLGIEAPEFSWRLAGPRPQLSITASAPPPAKVDLDGLRATLDKAGRDDLVLGLGRRGQPVAVSLAGDSPHLGLSMASGAGKSVAARLLAAQVLHRGGLAVFLDIKRISHVWARGLPNTAYAKDVAEIHETLLLLAREVARRNQIADEAADVEGEVQASVGPRVLVVCEELNATQARLKSYWREIKEQGDPGRSPAAEALDEIMFVGRQVNVNVLMIGQRLSASAAGSGDARENLAARILGRYSASTWKMLVPEFAMPSAARAPGRVQVVTSSVRECQIGFLTGQQARDYALSGTVAQYQPARFGARVIDPATPRQELPDFGSDQPVVTGTPLPSLQGPAEPITLSEAVKSGLIDRSLGALRMVRHRDASFPQPVGQRGVAHLFDADQLAAWQTRTKA